MYKDGLRDKWGNPKFKADEVMAKMADWEWAYAEHLPKLRCEPQGDAVAIAVELFNKYQRHLMKFPPQGPEFEALLKPAVVDRDRTQVMVDEEIKKVIHRGPYVK